MDSYHTEFQFGDLSMDGKYVNFTMHISDNSGLLSLQFCIYPFPSNPRHLPPTWVGIKLFSLGSWELPCRSCRLHRWQARGAKVSRGWVGGPQLPLSVSCTVYSSIWWAQNEHLLCAQHLPEAGEEERDRVCVAHGASPARGDAVSHRTPCEWCPPTSVGHPGDKEQRAGRL